MLLRRLPGVVSSATTALAPLASRARSSLESRRPIPARLASCVGEGTEASMSSAVLKGEVNSMSRTGVGVRAERSPARLTLEDDSARG